MSDGERGDDLNIQINAVRYIPPGKLCFICGEQAPFEILEKSGDRKQVCETCLDALTEIQSYRRILRDRKHNPRP